MNSYSIFSKTWTQDMIITQIFSYHTILELSIVRWVNSQLVRKTKDLREFGSQVGATCGGCFGLISLEFPILHTCCTNLLERGKFQKSSSRIYGAHTMVFQAQISNFIEFGPEMAQRNGLKVFGLFCTFPWF